MAKFCLIYQDLKAKINEGIYRTNDLLPSESGLCDLYDASRDTIRKALSRLREEGYIQSQKGKGSIVINRQRYVFPVSDVISYKELATRRHISTHTTVIKDKITKLPISDFASVDPTAKAIPVTKLVRVREVNGEPVIIDIDYVSTDVVPGISHEVAADSIYRYFEEELHLSIAYAKKEITVEPATDSDQELLHLKAGDVVVVVKSVTSLEDTTTFQYTESRHRPDRFRFQDFARRL
ncbi:MULTISPECIES: trehalose operon repressor [Caproicibacterium]|jgi:GntR family trehalose operon transcriptional repressor|uniref:Trehalose operon repressor n=1 Tax=Caproicibacterium lactatifermentans TaxID=2666138 RepID=A0A859DX87_9FIRM|nr:trehalose operon repressor [Caproicibacterium lactatifermentans]ARP49672.1 trehalose operon repressor [Ruminococcaceae bacterium CPB6]QKN24591.1 trehalose operon repressor [Caproicibacterium lactatifermentans]QKO30212.1 trehalose operon repressor [Caproicibacterium lactatifermentans]